MARSYRKPMMNVEKFVANEYVAACGVSGVVYKFKCDAGGEDPGYVYLETNGKPGLQIGGDQFLGGYQACGITHEAESTDSFRNGYYVNYSNGRVTPVIVWRGPNNDNIHCTENLNMDSWETSKS